MCMNKNNKSLAGKNTEGLKRIYSKLFCGLMIAWGMFESHGFYVYANVTQFGTRAKNWIINELLTPLCIVVVLIGCVTCFAKKAWVQLIVWVIGGGVVCFFVANPDMIRSIGDGFAQILFG